MHTPLEQDSIQRPSRRVIIQPRTGLFDFGLDAIWEYRELIYFLVWRDVKSRYKQSVLGVGWAIAQPVLQMLIFWAIFNLVARIPSDGIPYPLFAFIGLLPWQYFAQAVARASNGLVGNTSLVTKVYFPRVIIPLAAALVPSVDFLVSLVALGGIMAWYGLIPSLAALVLPVLMFVAFATALGTSLWLSALNVRYRDVGMLVPFLTQIWMYLTPVIYPLSMIPERWQPVYGLNPMVTVVAGIRWALVGGEGPDMRVSAMSLFAVAVLFFGGLVYFRRAERDFADVI